MTEWYERSFGADYILIYKHRNWENAQAEAKLLAQWMGLPVHSRLLDVGCGMGRHAIALAEQGYKVTGIDLSTHLLKEARRKDEEGKVAFVHGDMRRLPFADGEFDATLNLFTSFGYFEEEEDNVQVLQELRRVLRADGQFLIDYLNPRYIRDHLVPRSERVDAESGCIITETRTIEGNWVKKQIELKVGDDVRHYAEQVCLYELEWFAAALQRSGLRLEAVCGDYDGSPYNELQSKRLIMTGRVMS